MQRKSNIELLRIVAMILVVFLHANYYSLGSVSVEDISNSPFGSFCKALIEQLCIVCVNVFILISGWFGIKPSLKGATSLLFQILFFHVLIITVLLVVGERVHFYDILRGLYFGSDYWFITSYVILYAISPILNTFIEAVSVRTFASVLIAFFFCEFVYGWIVSSGDFQSGYSALSFVGLYLLAQFIHKYSYRLQSIVVFKNFLLYFIFTLVPITLYFITGRQFNMLAYSSPFVIAASVFLFLAFHKMKISSTAINYIACSSLSIYIVHQHPLIVNHFINLMKYVHTSFGPYWYVVFVILFVVTLGCVCILLDKLRIRLWIYSCDLFIDKLLSKIKIFFDRIYNFIGIQ